MASKLSLAGSALLTLSACNGIDASRVAEDRLRKLIVTTGDLCHVTLEREPKLTETTELTARAEAVLSGKDSTADSECIQNWGERLNVEPAGDGSSAPCSVHYGFRYMEADTSYQVSANVDCAAGAIADALAGE